MRKGGAEVRDWSVVQPLRPPLTKLYTKRQGHSFSWISVKLGLQ